MVSSINRSGEEIVSTIQSVEIVVFFTYLKQVSMLDVWYISSIPYLTRTYMGECRGIGGFGDADRTRLRFLRVSVLFPPQSMTRIHWISRAESLEWSDNDAHHDEFQMFWTIARVSKLQLSTLAFPSPKPGWPHDVGRRKSPCRKWRHVNRVMRRTEESLRQSLFKHRPPAPPTWPTQKPSPAFLLVTLPQQTFWIPSFWFLQGHGPAAESAMAVPWDQTPDYLEAIRREKHANDLPAYSESRYGFSTRLLIHP